MQLNKLIVEFQDSFRRLRLDAVLLNTSEITRSVNLRRLSGFSGSDASLLITPHAAHLFTDGRYQSQSRQECKGLKVHVTRNKIKSVGALIKSHGVRKLGLEGSRISYEFVSALRKRLPYTDFVNLKRPFLDGLRIRKTSQEAELIRSAAVLASQACMQVIDAGLEGRPESDIAANLETLFRHKGASGPSFSTIVASGHRSALPHGAATSKVVERGDLVIIDYGCRLADYCSDETLTCIVNAEPDPKQQKIFQAVKDAHDKAIESLRVGMKANALDRIARDVVAEAGFGAKFLHSLGHGVGLEVHEAPYLSPKSNETIESGMVFTIEPGVYIEGVGGVRLESLVYLADNGPDVLSTAPKTLVRSA